MFTRFFLCLLGFTLVHASVQGQQQLTMYPSFGGAHFEYEKDSMIYQVGAKQVAQILYDDPLAYAEFKKARTNSTLGGILGFAGAGLMIIPVASIIAGGDPEWAFAAGGAALIIGSIPLSASYKRHAQHAIESFNKKFTAFQPRAEYYFLGSGVKVVIRF